MTPGCATPTLAIWQPWEDWAGELRRDGSWGMEWGMGRDCIMLRT